MKIKDFFDNLVFDKFLLNFIPGLILFYVLTMFIDVSIGEGLTSFLIVASVSWVLGLILELVFFRKSYLKRREENRLTKSDSLNLLFGKIGVSIVIACILWIDLEWLMNLFDNMNEKLVEMIRLIIKLLLFTIGGILLYIYYRKNNGNNNLH